MIHFNSTNPLGPKHTKSQIWLTPKWIIDALGGYEVFDLDVCAHLPNGKPIIQTAKQYYTEKEDGLKSPWFFNVWCNPPYNDLGSWLRKMSEHKNGIILCFARTDTKAWQYVKTATGINFIKGRIKFLNENGEGNQPANAASCLIAWSEENYKRIKNIDGLYVRIDNG